MTKLRTAAMQLAMGLAPARRQASALPPRLTGLSSLVRPKLQATLRPAPAARGDGVGPPAGACVHARRSACARYVREEAARARTIAAHQTEETPECSARCAVGAAGNVAPHAAPRAADPSRFVLDPKVFPVLTQLGKNLTLAAAHRELDAVVGREEEIERVLDVLAKRRANSPCLVGAAGVGKTSVARGSRSALRRV